MLFSIKPTRRYIKRNRCLFRSGSTTRIPEGKVLVLAPKRHIRFLRRSLTGCVTCCISLRWLRPRSAWRSRKYGWNRFVNSRHRFYWWLTGSSQTSVNCWRRRCRSRRASSLRRATALRQRCFSRAERAPEYPADSGGSLRGSNIRSSPVTTACQRTGNVSARCAVQAVYIMSSIVRWLCRVKQHGIAPLKGRVLSRPLLTRLTELLKNRV